MLSWFEKLLSLLKSETTLLLACFLKIQYTPVGLGLRATDRKLESMEGQRILGFGLLATTKYKIAPGINLFLTKCVNI